MDIEHSANIIHVYQFETIHEWSY